MASRRIVAAELLAAASVLLIITAAGPRFSQPHSEHNLQLVDVVDNLSWEEPSLDKTGPYRINLQGYWSKEYHSPLTFYVTTTTDNSISEQIVESAKDVLVNMEYDAGSNSSSSSSYVLWAGMLEEMSQNREGIPSLEMSPSEAEADIKVILTDQQHPEGKVGLTRILVVKDTKQILSAQIKIFSASQLYESKMLVPVLNHEVGHALGLSHSDSPESIMYPSFVIGGGPVRNHIGTCEAEGITALYAESRVDAMVICS